MKIIDFHTHIVPPEIIQKRTQYLERDRWFKLLYENPKSKLVTAEQLVAAMDRDGVDKAVTFGFAWADMGLCRLANDYVHDAVRRFPGRLIPYAVVNPLAGEEALLEMDRCASLGFQGVGELMPDGQGYTLADQAVLASLLTWLSEQAYPLLVHATEPVGHLYPGKGEDSLEAVYRLAANYPELQIICAHWGGGLLFYELMPEVRSTLTNVYYDIAASPFLYEKTILSVAAQVVPDKVLFGTDYPLIGYKRFLAYVRQAGLAKEDLSRVLGDNAERLLTKSEVEGKSQEG
jgi:hypothetical protein